MTSHPYPGKDTVDQPAGPYPLAAMRYLSAGWSPLPLPARRKADPPPGWTGRHDAWPSGADVHAWTEDHPNGNIGLRLPPDVLGIDVDHYDAKPGGTVLQQLEQQLGALPATWRTTSRDDGTSGIRLYRVPPELRWPNDLGPGIEVIRHRHRYTVAWPSIHPDTGGTYRWITPDGVPTINDIPNANNIPHLPTEWVDHFTNGERATDQARANLDPTTANTWMNNRGTGTPCRYMTTATDEGLTNLTTGGSRHDAALAATNRIIWLAGEGHTGATHALTQLHAAFQAAATDRSPSEFAGEWARMTNGAIDIAAAAHPTPNADPCTDQFAGLINNSKDQQWTKSSATQPSFSNASQQTQTTDSTQPESPTPSKPSSSSPNEPQPPSTQDQETSPETDTGTDERTSWWPRDLTATLSGDNPTPPPEYLNRSDGHGTWYRGRVNGIIGPSESGKTWLALHGITQAVHDGHNVTILDFEDTEDGVINRLINLGLTPEQVATHVAYIAPDEPFIPYTHTGIDLAEHLNQWQPVIVFLDGFNAAMTIQGLDLMSNTDATRFFQTILNPIADLDIAVVYVDHTPKDKTNESSGGIGAQAKRAMTKGCALKVDVIKPFGKGQEGKLRVYVDKDRQGHVRGISAPNKSGHWAGDVTINGTTSNRVVISFDAPEGFDPTNPSTPTEFRPTGYMGKVSRWLLDNPGAGRNEIVDGVTGNDPTIKTALRSLVEEGWVTVEKGARNKSLHTVATPFNELIEPPNTDRGHDRGPTGGQAPVETTGATGGHDRDVVPSYPDPGQHASTTPVESTGVNWPQSQDRWKPIAGGQYEVNDRNGEVRER